MLLKLLTTPRFWNKLLVYLCKVIIFRVTYLHIGVIKRVKYLRMTSLMLSMMQPLTVVLEKIIKTRQVR